MSDALVPDPGEHLTDGWEPDLAADDTLVRQAVRVHASWPVALASSSGRPWHRDENWAGAWIGDRGAFTNFVVPTRPPKDPDALTDDVSVLIPPHVPYALVDAWQTNYSDAGLTLIGHPPLMVRFPAPGPATLPPGVEVREVQDGEALARAESILVEGYPMPDLQPLTPGDFFGPSILDGPTRVWIGYVDGSPAAVAAAHHASGVTLVEFVAALPAARGRGAGGAVTWAATLSEPGAPALLVASDEGRPVYTRMGYHAIERWSAWLRLPA